MRGDVLFFTPQRGNLLDHAIARFTGGRFCHVAVDLGDGWCLEATTRGVRKSPLLRPVAGHYTPASTSGLSWLVQQIGLRYGWLDTIDAVIRLLFRTTFFVARPRSYDCSDLATRYLSHSGLDNVLGPLADAPHLVTPNDLARQLGVQ